MTVKELRQALDELTESHPGVEEYEVRCDAGCTIGDEFNAWDVVAKRHAIGGGAIVIRGIEAT